MKELVDILVSCGKIPYSDELVAYEKPRETISVLARRPDESLLYPLEPINVPEDVKTKANEFIEGAKYTPELLWNVRRLRFESKPYIIDANLTNYGSLVAIRRLTSSLSKDVIYKLSNKIAAFAVLGMVKTRGKIKDYRYEGDVLELFRRTRTAQVGKMWHYAPAGNIDEKSDIIRTLWEEAEEETDLHPNDITGLYLLGIIRGRTHSVNPAAVFLMESDKAPRPNPKEHDLVEHLPLEEDLFRKQITEKIRQNLLVDNCIGATILASGILFTSKYACELERNLKDELKISIAHENPFK